MAEQFDDAYSDSEDSLEGETPTMDQIIIDAIDARLLETHTAMPCEVVKMRGNSFCDIQPSLQRKYTDGKVVNLPIIQNVPISHPRGSSWSIKFPIKVGDKGLAIFAERSIDAWSVSGGTVNPSDPRMHDLTDAIFIPGLYPSSSPVEGKDSEMILVNGKSKIVLQEDGKFLVKNAVNETFDLLVQLLQTLIEAQVPTLMGPQTFVPITTEALMEIKAKLETLKGG